MGRSTSTGSVLPSKFKAEKIHMRSQFKAWTKSYKKPYAP